MERYNRINKISVVQSQSAQETLSAEKLDVLGALVLSGNDAVVTINSAHNGVDGYTPDTMNIRDYVNKWYQLEGKVSPLSVVNSPTVTLQGKLAVNNGKQGVATAIKRNYPNLDIVLNNEEGIVFFKDPEVEKIVKQRMYERRGGIGYNGVVTLALLNKEWSLDYLMKSTTIEYFNEFALFKRASCLTFTGCQNLKEITLPPRVTTIPRSYFELDENLEKINLGNITEFFPYCFNRCAKVPLTSLNPNTTSIQQASFNKCARVTIFTLPSSLTEIGEQAFSESGVTISVIPSSVTILDRLAFMGCLGITTMDIRASVETLSEGVFRDCTNLRTVTLHDGLKIIGREAFRNSGITALETPSSLTEIYERAFLQCTNLTTLTFNVGLKEIKDDAFNGCAFATLSLPNGLEKIGGSAFRNNNITTLSLPSSLKWVGANAFYDSRNTFASAMIKTNANNERYVDWRGVDFIGNGNFGVNGTSNKFYYLLFDGIDMGNTKSSSSTMGDENGANTASCTKAMFDGTLSQYFAKYNQNTQSTPLYLLDSTDNAEDAGFWLKDSNGDWTRLPSEITVPSEVTELANSLFRSIKEVSSIIAPQVTKIGYRVVWANSNLKRFNSRRDGVYYFPNYVGGANNGVMESVSLGCFYASNTIAIFPSIQYAGMYLSANVRTMDFGANLSLFSNYTWNGQTKTVVFRGTTPPQCNENTLGFIPTKIYVPQSALETYKTDSFFYRYRDIIFAIGGTEWTAQFGSSGEYADYPDGSQNSSVLINN